MDKIRAFWITCQICPHYVFLPAMWFGILTISGFTECPLSKDVKKSYYVT
uniref:Gamma-secretase subunit PEN-2 n=1 Tax=Heterorhabditis bacteriophora TaxID=37862 RepID=A0A1I7WTH0_HETBA